MVKITIHFEFIKILFLVEKMVFTLIVNFTASSLNLPLDSNMYQNHQQMKNLLILLFLFTFSVHFNYGQKVHAVEYENQADIKVFVVQYENQADLKVFKVNYENQADGNEGKWFFTNYPNQAKKKVFFVKYQNQADIKVFFVKYQNQAGWLNRAKMHLLY
ncbi:hypothetical protein Belba_3113 [Belliella baltica DSM 15883]|uniref:7(1) septoil knot domain-containing protein n=2 Tax=Belliella TaxID=232244 RepID=I3Z8Q9_BELBD|nr:hypothetical protein Belba_3113 [Belliella baltica DSM 15883]